MQKRSLPLPYLTFKVKDTIMMNNNELSKRVKEVAAYFEGDVSLVWFDMYDAINKHFYYGKLPQPFILQALTPYGRCIGETKGQYPQPIILLHPILRKNTNERKAWFWVLVHEALHVYTRYVLGKGGGHNTITWVTEANRIAEQLGYETDFGLSVAKRWKLKEGGDGKVHRFSTTNMDYNLTPRFPQCLDGYNGKVLPPIDTFL